MSPGNLIDEKTEVKIEGLLFRLGMWWRILYGLVRFIAGLALMRMIGTPLADVFFRLMRTELLEDPSDHLVQMIGHTLYRHSYEVTFFLAFYLIFWGVLDVWLSVSMLKHQLWSFPISITLITGFVTYEIIRFIHTHSLVLLSVIVLDIVIVWVIWQEYKRRLALSLSHSKV